jgi:hypothetical protein
MNEKECEKFSFSLVLSGLNGRIFPDKSRHKRLQGTLKSRGERTGPYACLEQS